VDLYDAGAQGGNVNMTTTFLITWLGIYLGISAAELLDKGQTIVLGQTITIQKTAR
jgi:hypothetical protein